MKKIFLWLSIFMVIVSIFIMTMPAFADDTVKDIQIQYMNIAPTTPPSSGNNGPSKWITAWVDHSDNIYHFGEKIEISLKSTKDCYIYIIDIGTSGKVTIIYPNDYDKNNFLKAYEVRKLPPVNAKYSFVATPPQGKELIKVIATSKPVTLEELSHISKRKIGGFTQITGDPKEYAKDIAIQLNQTPNLEWDVYDKVITLIP